MGCGILYWMLAEQIGLCATLATRRTGVSMLFSHTSSGHGLELEISPCDGWDTLWRGSHHMIMDVIPFSSTTHAVIPLVGVVTLNCRLKGFRQGGQPISTAAAPGTSLQSCYCCHIVWRCCGRCHCCCCCCYCLASYSNIPTRYNRSTSQVRETPSTGR